MPFPPNLPGPGPFLPFHETAQVDVSTTTVILVITGEDKEGMWQQLNRAHENKGHWDDVSQGRVLRWPP